MPKLNMETLLPFIEEAFNRGADFQIPVTGTSMNPLLYQNRDFVKIVKPALPLKIGDIPLYRRRNGVFVLHRVVGIKPNGEYIMCGDNQFILEHGITDANIIGIAKTLVIDGREVDVDTDADYLKHKEKYIKNLKTRYPVRRLRYKLHNIKCGIKVQNAKRKAQSEFECGIRNSEFVMNKSEIKTVGDGFIRPEEDILNTGSILINAIRAQITGEDFKFPENTDFDKLFRLAHSHRVTAMVAPFVIKCDFAQKQIKSTFSKELFKYAARYTAQSKEYTGLSAVLSENNIRHCFLKGTKVGRFYDNPDLRFMLDMDLYVENNAFSAVEELLIGRGYEKASNGDDKDTAYIKKPFLIIELHKEIKYDYDKGYDYYKGAFERMLTVNGFEMNMTNEDFYVYILSHSAHHFEVAGTGIKSVVDHYYLRKKLKPQCDSAVLEKALEDIGLTKFNQRFDNLCDYWFEGAAGDSLTEETARYVILSGVFGNDTNNYLSGVVKGRYSESNKAHLLKRLFPPLKKLSERYTVLKKLPFLLPVFWVIRIFSAFSDRGRISKEANAVNSADDSMKKAHKDFLDNMGL